MQCQYGSTWAIIRTLSMATKLFQFSHKILEILSNSQRQGSSLQRDRKPVTLLRLRRVTAHCYKGSPWALFSLTQLVWRLRVVWLKRLETKPRIYFTCINTYFLPHLHQVSRTLVVCKWLGSVVLSKRSDVMLLFDSKSVSVWLHAAHTFCMEQYQAQFSYNWLWWLIERWLCFQIMTL